VACVSEEYLQQLEQQSGRAFLEASAAAAILLSHRMVCIYADGAPLATPQRVQQLLPLELRKLFVSKHFVRTPLTLSFPRYRDLWLLGSYYGVA
jgi:hypothetical protein